MFSNLKLNVNDDGFKDGSLHNLREYIKLKKITTSPPTTTITTTHHHTTTKKLREKELKKAGQDTLMVLKILLVI